jgi:hypothetical protein
MSALTEALVTIAVAIVGVAIVAVLVSRNANTAAVIQAGASGFGNALDVAISPVTGNTVQPNLAYPGGSMMGAFTPSAINMNVGMGL